MLGWLFPRPPVPVQDKAWIEYRFAWLVKQFGPQRLFNSEVIEPTDEFFPETYTGDHADAQALFRQICRFMQVNPNEMRFEVLPDERLESFKLHYDCSHAMPILRLAESQIVDPFALVGTLAHEIARHILANGETVPGDDRDRERIIDLLACVSGLGIFIANSTVVFSSASSTWKWWNAQRYLLMPPDWVGYSLAIFSWLRGERSPRWARHLRLNAREPLNIGLRYLYRKRDCYIMPETLRTAIQPALSELESRLCHGTPTAKVHALWDLARHDEGRSHAVLVRRLTCNRNPAVRAAAMKALADLQLRDELSVRDLTTALCDANCDVRVAAAKALGVLTVGDAEAILELGHALSDAEPIVVEAAAAALREYGEQAAPAVKDVLAALHNAFIECDYEMIDVLIDVLRRAAADPGQSINDYFTERDPEFRQKAIDALYRENESGIIYDDEHST